MTNELTREQLKLTIVFSVGYAVVALILSPVAGAIAFTLLGWSFQVITLGGLLTGGIAILNAWVSTYGDIRWAITQTIATELAHRSAEADRIQAEADAIRGAQASQIAINSGSGNIKQTANKPTVYRANGAIQHIGEQVNVVKVEQPQFLSVSDDDTFWMLERLTKLGLARGQHIGQVFPFSREKVRREVYEAIIAALIEADKIKNRRQGYAGELTEQDPRQLVKVIQSKFPEGVKIPMLGSGT